MAFRLVKPIPWLLYQAGGAAADVGQIATWDGTRWIASTAGSGSGDVLGSGTPTVGDPVKATNADGKHIGPGTRTAYNAVDHGGAVVHATNDVGSDFRTWLGGLSNCTVVFPPCAAGTYYCLTSDLSTPATVHIIQPRGSLFNLAVFKKLILGGSYEAGSYKTFVDNSTQNTLISITNTGVARDAGGGTIGIPMPTGHGVVGGNYVKIVGTTNYEGVQSVASVSANEIVITATYVAETFGATATAQNISLGVHFAASSNMPAVHAAWWGALPCASSDNTQALINTAAINQALNSGVDSNTDNTRGRLAVLLGPGSYALNPAPALTANCILKGSASGTALIDNLGGGVQAGMGTVLCPSTSSTDYTLKSLDTGGWIVRDMTIFDNSAANKDALYITSAIGAWGARVTNCVFQTAGTGTYGIRANTGRLEVDHNRFVGSAYYDYADSFFHGNEIHGATAIAVYLNNTICRGNIIYLCGTGIYCNGSAIVEGNNIAQCTNGIDCGAGNNLQITGNQITYNKIAIRLNGNSSNVVTGNTLLPNDIAICFNSGNAYQNNPGANSITGVVKNNIMGFTPQTSLASAGNKVNFHVPYSFSSNANRGLPLIEDNTGCDLPGLASSPTVAGRFAYSNGAGVIDSTGAVSIAPSSATNLFSETVTTTLTQPGGAGNSLIATRATGDWATSGWRCGDLVLHKTTGDERYTDIFTIQNISQTTAPAGAYDILTLVANSRNYTTWLGSDPATWTRLPDIFWGKNINLTAAAPTTVAEVYGYGDGNTRNLIAYPGDNITYSTWGNANYGYKYTVAAGGTCAALTGTDTLFEAVGDGLLLEAYQPFSGVKFVLSQALAGTGVTIGTKYYNGTTWVQLPDVVTSNYLSATGTTKIYFKPPQVWMTDNNAIGGTGEAAGYRYKILITLTAGTGLTAAVTSAMTQASWMRLRGDTWPGIAVTEMESLTLKCVNGIWKETSRSDSPVAIP